MSKGSRDDTEDVPGLLDEVTALLRRARGKVNWAASAFLEVVGFGRRFGVVVRSS